MFFAPELSVISRETHRERANHPDGVKITTAAEKPRKIGVAFGVELEGL
jgi:hypothetical protein